MRRRGSETHKKHPNRPDSYLLTNKVSYMVWVVGGVNEEKKEELGRVGI
jgi:hypothetical protein